MSGSGRLDIIEQLGQSGRRHRPVGKGRFHPAVEFLG